jgi:hypothetical protein
MKKNSYSPSLIAFSIIVFGLLNTIAGCKSNEPYVYVCKDGIIDIQEVTNLKHFQSTINPRDSLATLVIRTEQEYRNYIVDRLANIDFSRETLLAGRVRTAMPGRLITQSVTSSCASNNLVYDIKIKVNAEGTTAYAETPFFVTIPKIPESTNVTFNVHF